MKLLYVLAQLQRQSAAQALFLVYIPTRQEPVMFSKPHHCNLDRYTHKHTRVQAAHVYTHSQVRACHSTSLPRWRRAYGGRGSTNNVRKEQTPRWFHSTDTLINRNVSEPGSVCMSGRERSNGVSEGWGGEGEDFFLSWWMKYLLKGISGCLTPGRMLLIWE